MNKQHALCRATGKTSHLLQLCWRGFVFVDLLIISSVLHASNDINPYADMDIESLLNVEIVTASKYSQKQSESASSTTVIDKQQIKLFGYRTLADALRSVPGFFVVNDGTYQNVGVRGFDQSSSFNARMLIMIDGIRINSGIYDDGFAGSQLPLDIDLVERIEVLRGPSSSMYGNNAFFAVINLITRNGKEFQGGELAGSYSSFDTFKGRASYGRKHTNGLEYLISATGLNSEGPALKFPGQASANNPSGLTQDTNYEYNRQVFAKAHWGDFSFEGGYGPTKKGNPGAPYGVNFNDPNSFSTDREAFANLQYDKVLEPKLNLIARAFYGDYDFTGGYPYGSIMNYSKAHSWWSGFESRLVSTYFDRHSLIAGIEVTEFWMQNQSAFDLNPYALYSQDTRDSHRIGIYLQDDFTVTKQLKLSLGARVDDNSLVKKLMFSPRIGLIYQPFTATLLRLQYGKAFRAPNVSEQFQAYAPVIADDGSVTKGLLANPSLQPEQIETYELSIEQAIAKEWRCAPKGAWRRGRPRRPRRTTSTGRFSGLFASPTCS